MKNQFFGIEIEMTGITRTDATKIVADHFGTAASGESVRDTQGCTWVNEDELFTRLLYYGTVHLNRSEEQTWLTPIGLLLDLWEWHKHYLGWTKPKREVFIDDIIPMGI